MHRRIPRDSPLVFTVLLVLLVFCWIEVDLYAPAFPQMRRAFGTTEAMIQLSLSLNFLGYFVSSLVVGPLAVALLLPESHPPHRRMPFSPARMLRSYGTLLGNRRFLFLVFGLVFLVTPYFVFIATVPFLFLEALGLEMGQYGYFQGSVAGLFAFLSLLVPFLVGRTDSRRLTLGSITLSLAASVLLALRGWLLPDSALGLTVLMALLVAGMVWPCSCVFAQAFESFPDLKGSACSLFSAIRMGVMAGAARAGAPARVRCPDRHGRPA